MGTPIRAIAGAIGSGNTHPWMKVVVSGLGGLVLALVAIPVSAAERLIVGYGVLEQAGPDSRMADHPCRSRPGGRGSVFVHRTG